MKRFFKDLKAICDFQIFGVGMLKILLVKDS